MSEEAGSFLGFILISRDNDGRTPNVRVLPW